MARVTITQYICDITGQPVEEGEHVALEFTVNGTTYTLDTDKDGAAMFDKAMKPYTDAARVVKASRGTRKSGSVERTRKIREWAVSQGIDVADRGRVPAKVIEQYEKAHK